MTNKHNAHLLVWSTGSSLCCHFSSLHSGCGMFTQYHEASLLLYVKVVELCLCLSIQQQQQLVINSNNKQPFVIWRSTTSSKTSNNTLLRYRVVDHQLLLVPTRLVMLYNNPNVDENYLLEGARFGQ